MIGTLSMTFMVTSSKEFCRSDISNEGSSVTATATQEAGHVKERVLKHKVSPAIEMKVVRVIRDQFNSQIVYPFRLKEICSVV